MITDSLTVDRATFEQRTGWTLKPEGACKGDHCIPLNPAPEGDRLDVGVLAEQMGLPVVHDADHRVWAIGPESIGARSLASAEAPNLTLPDLDGKMFELHSLRGRKVLIVAWSPY